MAVEGGKAGQDRGTRWHLVARYIARGSAAAACVNVPGLTPATPAPLVTSQNQSNPTDNTHGGPTEGEWGSHKDVHC